MEQTLLSDQRPVLTYAYGHNGKTALDLPFRLTQLGNQTKHRTLEHRHHRTVILGKKGPFSACGVPSQPGGLNSKFNSPQLWRLEV